MQSTVGFFHSTVSPFSASKFSAQSTGVRTDMEISFQIAERRLQAQPSLEAGILLGALPKRNRAGNLSEGETSSTAGNQAYRPDWRTQGLRVSCRQCNRPARP